MTLFAHRLRMMSMLEDHGIVRELMPEHDGCGGSIWSWKVLKPELLPHLLWLQANLTTNNGLIRL